MGGWDYTLFEVSRARDKVSGEFSAAGNTFNYKASDGDEGDLHSGRLLRLSPQIRGRAPAGYRRRRLLRLLARPCSAHCQHPCPASSSRPETSGEEFATLPGQMLPLTGPAAMPNLLQEMAGRIRSAGESADQPIWHDQPRVGWSVTEHQKLLGLHRNGWSSVQINQRISDQFIDGE